MNSDISRVLSSLGHTDTICIGDCGLPIPDTVEPDPAGVAGFKKYLERYQAALAAEKAAAAMQ